MAGNRPRAKYQVFISSTFRDLKDVREAVTWEILKASHIPAGMENFPATDDRGWKIIQRTIDRSDYYVLLVAGLYGSLDETGKKSWTEREYDYAKSQGLPVLAFVRNDAAITADLVEKKADGQKRLGAFKQKLLKAHLLERWSTKDELAAKVIQALRNQIDDDDANGTQRPGWFRGDEIPSGLAVEEFARLTSENEALKAKLASAVEAKEILALTRDDGAAVADEVFRVVDHQYDPARGTGPAFTMAEIGGSSAAEVQQYVSDLTMVHWLRLKLKNTGGQPARKLIAKFAVTEADGVEIHSLERPHGMIGVIPRHKPWYYDNNEPVFVSSQGKKPPYVEQRIEQVGVEQDERLVAMGFRAERTGAPSYRLTIEYEIVSEQGVRIAGTFTDTVEIGETKRLTKKDVYG